MKKIILFLLFASSPLISCKKDLKKPEESTKIASKNMSCAPPVVDSKWYETDNKAPLFDGMQVAEYKISTDNPEVQKYFNQGLALAYGFNHAEAARSFYYATKLDSECAMCFWGYAYVLGPNYNAGMEADNYERAYKAIQTALKLSVNATDKEKALIEALSKRYVKEPIEDRSPLDIAYSEAMKKVSKKYPDDATINTLYAESVMNLHPWDLYDKSGKAKPWTPEIVALLEKILVKNPKHIGANHYYIHAVESSNKPQQGYVSAKFFDNGNADALGHLIHMSSHIYIRTGDYHKGTLSNIKACKVDSTYATACNAQGAYPLAYFPHNYHFLAATATLEGNYKWAMFGAEETAKLVHPKNMVIPGFETLQHYYMIPYFVAVKFGKWDDILKMKLVTDTLKYPNAISHYAKGMAYLGKNNLQKAKAELQQLEPLTHDEDLKKMSIWQINTLSSVVEIAYNVLKAEILASENNYSESIVLLNKAVALEDQLNYNEPPDWFFSVRHHLGAVLIENGKYKEAIKVFEEDLQNFPKNGWAHQGLKVAYHKLNEKSKEAEINDLIKNSWATADIKIASSRIK